MQASCSSNNLTFCEAGAGETMQMDEVFLDKEKVKMHFQIGLLSPTAALYVTQQQKTSLERPVFEFSYMCAAMPFQNI